MNRAASERHAPDWDALAAIWHCFEGRGFDRHLLDRVMPSLRAPVVYVGGGRGTLPAQIRAAVGEVITIDASLPMATMAQRRFGLSCAAADVRRLPLLDGAAGSALCATGVLEYLADAEIVAALGELRRVSAPEGTIWVAATAQRDDADPARPCSRPITGVHALLERWRADEASLPAPIRQPFAATALELGDRDAAYRFLRAALPDPERVLGFEALATLVDEAELEVVDADLIGGCIGLWHLRCRGGRRP